MNGNGISVALNMFIVNPLSANPTKWSNTLKKFFGKLPTNYLSVFDHFAWLALKGLTTKTRTYVAFIIIFKYYKEI